MWIKASKTNFYRIVAKYVVLPKMKETHFEEVREQKIHYLKWRTACGSSYRASLSMTEGNLSLMIETIDEKNESPCCSFLLSSLNISDLIRRGMIKGIRHEHQLMKLKNTDLPYLS